MIKVAILVDGAFYLKRAKYLWGEKTPQDRADELITYCLRHLQDDSQEKENERAREIEPKFLYRIFYYDCFPSDKKVYHPLTKELIDLSLSPIYNWSNAFFEALKNKRKLAFRKGELLDSAAVYNLKPNIVNKLCNGEMSVNDLKKNDFTLSIQQKGVDMKIGLDIASIAYKKQVDQIVLIAGDSDFVPAAKHARREGIDFILDPMWHSIKPSLNEHIDGLITKVANSESERKEHDHLYNKSK